MGEDSSTLERILEAAKAEFLEKGFLGASLRNIVKEAGVTTGAFYRYYPTKEALFEALVKPCADWVLGELDAGMEGIGSLPVQEQTRQMTTESYGRTDRILDYIYEHYDRFKLLLCSAGGTAYEDFPHQIVEKEVASTFRYMDELRRTGHPVPALDRGLCHMIASGLFSSIFETVIHDMDKKEAKARIKLLEEFYTGGWERLLKVRFGEGGSEA